MVKKFETRNSTAGFLIFQIEGNEDGVQVVYQYEAIWCTQKTKVQPFDVDVSAVNKLLTIESLYCTNFHKESSVMNHASTYGNLSL